MPRLDVSLQCSSGTFVKTKQLTCTLWWLIWLISSTSVWSQSVPPSGRLIPFIWSIKVSKSSLHLSQIWAFYGVQPKEQVRSFYFLRKFWTALLGYKDLLPGLQIQRECFSTFSGIWSFELQCNGRCRPCKGLLDLLPLFPWRHGWMTTTRVR